MVSLRCRCHTEGIYVLIRGETTAQSCPNFAGAETLHSPLGTLRWYLIVAKRDFLAVVAVLRGLDPCELVLSWHLLLAVVKDHEVADQVQEPRLFQHLRQGSVQKVAGLRIGGGAWSFHSTKNFSGVPTVP